jgi:hypothetical protein
MVFSQVEARFIILVEIGCFGEEVNSLVFCPSLFSILNAFIYHSFRSKAISLIHVDCFLLQKKQVL